MPPTPEVRAAVKAVAVPVLPLRPNAESALPVPVIDRSALTPVEIASWPLELTDDVIWPAVVESVAAPWKMLAVFTPVARSIALSRSVSVAVRR